MMKKVCIFLPTILLFFVACRQNKNDGETENSNADSTTFFQVSTYIQSQIDDVQKTPYYIYKLDVIDGKKDSTPINTPIFKSLSGSFLEPDINDKRLKKYYTENVFHDQSTKSFAISYSTANKALEIQSVEVLMEEDGQTVKRLFIRKFFNYPDSTAIEQLSWKSGERFQINRLVQLPGNKEILRQTTVVWNGNS